MQAVEFVWIARLFPISYWQTSSTVTMLYGLMLVSENATLMLSPPTTAKVWVVSRQLEPLPFVDTEQVIGVIP
jgi:hypothetical protein